MKALLALIFFNMLFFSVPAEDDNKITSESKNNTTILFSGTVKDKSTGEFLVGAEVEIEGTNLKTYTDFDGNFVFENLNPGTYNLSAQYISYEKVELENFEIGTQTNLLELELDPLQ